MKRIVLLHTIKSVMDVFEKLVREKIPGVQIYSMYDDYLVLGLKDGTEYEPVNRRRLYKMLELAQEVKPDAILATCSSLSIEIDNLRDMFDVPIVKVDENMLKTAVGMGKKIMVMATAQSTIEPALYQLKAYAQQAGKEIEIGVSVCSEAYLANRRGDKELHNRLLIEQAGKLEKHDVIILAQASMAVVEKDIQEVCGTPVLTSPRTAVDLLYEVVIGV